MYASRAYAAGLFDGEGTVVIQFYTQGKGLQTCLKIGMNDPRPLEYLEDSFGGTLRKDKRGSYVWYISGKASEDFAQAISPYAIVKKDQLELYLEVRSQINPNRRAKYSVEEVAERHEWVRKLLAIRKTPILLEV